MAQSAFATQKGAFTIDLVGQATPTNGGAAEVANPEGEDLIIEDVTLYVVTPSAGAANIDVGVGNAGADNSNLISALAVNGAITGLAYNGPAPAAKAQKQVWAAAQVLNATVSAASAAFVGRLYVRFFRTS